MNWDILKSSLEGLQTRGTNLQQKIRGLRRRLTLLLAVVGPGLITSNVDNDAGGIATYSQAGAQYGYALLWSLIPMTIALYVTEEMCARMGVITGKGLSDLIREEFGFRPTFFVMVTGFFVDLANVVAEFAGVAASMEMFHVSRYIAVPIAAILVWILGASRYISPSRSHLPDRVRVLCHVHHFGDPGQAGLAGGCQARCHSQPPVQFWLFTDAHGFGGNDDRAVAILLPASRFRREKSRAQAVSTSAR